MKTFVMSLLTAAVTATMTIDADTRTFRDEYGRARIFHGQNVVVKLPPYLPTQDAFDFDMSISDQDLVNLKDWGCKFIRLGVMWESVETAPGVYDLEYLDKIDALINRFAEYGMVTLVDNHQDLFSRRLCGEGVPAFYQPWDDIDHSCPWSVIGTMFKIAGKCKAIGDYDLRYDEDGLPLVQDCHNQNFMDLYTAPEVASSFQALYENKNGLLDKMMDFWTVVATKMRSNPNVIGYDILNEPWGANLYHDSSLFFHPSKFDRTILYPVHVRAHETIRKVDDEKAIFFEPAQFPDTQPFFGGIPVPVGFPDSPGGPEYRNRQVLNDHTYCCQAAGSICALGEPQLDKSQECRTFHFNKLKQRAADAERYGVPLFYTEFGACFDGEECAVEINNSADAFDSQMASWSYWMYKSFGDFTTTGGPKEGMYNPDGTPQALKLKALTRTYITAFQGTPSSMYFSTTNSTFASSWVLDTSIDAPTEVYVHKALWYPDGWKSVVTHNGQAVEDVQVSTSEDSNYVDIKITGTKLTGKQVDLLLTPPMADSGVLASTEFNAAWTATDLGQSGSCKFEAQFEDGLPKDIVLHLNDRNGSRIAEINKVSPIANVSCFDIVDGQLLLVRLPSGFLQPTDVLATQSLAGMNGHSMSLTIAATTTVVTI